MLAVELAQFGGLGVGQANDGPSKRPVNRLQGNLIFLRKLGVPRHLEEMFLSLQAGIRKGDPRSIEVGVKLLVHKAEMNGYKAPARVDMTGTRVDVLVQQQAAADAQALADLDRLTLEELREYRRLEAKARSAPDLIDGDSPQAGEAQSSDKSDGAK